MSGNINGEVLIVGLIMLGFLFLMLPAVCSGKKKRRQYEEITGHTPEEDGWEYPQIDEVPAVGMTLSGDVGIGLAFVEKYYKCPDCGSHMLKKKNVNRYLCLECFLMEKKWEKRSD